jgi:hypothetical protein
MADVRQMKARVLAVIKRLDANASPSTFYDDASERLFVTIAKGSKKVSVTLRGRDFMNGEGDTINRTIEDGVKRLEHTPIG